MSRWQEIGIPAAGVALVLVLCIVVTTRDVRRWATRSGLELTPGEEAPVRRAIRTTRTAGLLGALLGFVVIPIAFQTGTGVFANWLIAAAVMVALLVVGELRTHRPSGEVVSARLDVRSVDQYLPGRAADLSRWAAAATMVLVAAAPLVPEVSLASGTRPTAGTVLATLVLAPLTVVVVERVQQWIVTRPQPMTSDRAVRIDDAIRARSVHVLAGAELFLELQLLSIALWGIGFRRQWVVLAVVSGLVAVIGLVASVRVSNRRWTGRAAVSA